MRSVRPAAWQGAGEAPPDQFGGGYAPRDWDGDVRRM